MGLLGDCKPLPERTGEVPEVSMLDGILQLVYTSGGEKHKIQVFVGNNSNPNILLGNFLGGERNSVSTITVPVMKGQYWQIKLTNGADFSYLKTYWYTMI